MRGTITLAVCATVILVTYAACATAIKLAGMARGQAVAIEIRHTIDLSPMIKKPQPTTKRP